MPPRKVCFQIIGVLCIILTISGGLMPPLNTMNILWIILYEVVVSLGAIGILFLIYHRGFQEDTMS